MARQVQLRRGTTSEHSSFTGAVGEVTVDTTKDTVVVHDGSTAGGVPLAKSSELAAKVESLADLSITATAAELNVLDGFTGALADVNRLDVTTEGSSEASKVLTADSNGDVTFSSDVAVSGTLDIVEVKEKVAFSTTTSGTTDQSLLVGAITYFTANQTANRTINFRGDSSTTLNSVMSTGQSMTFTALLTQGSTAYYLNAYQIDGTAVTPKWSGGSAPTSGNASGIDVYTFTIIKTADATFTVLASQTQYA
jgi:hypothetical protein